MATIPRTYITTYKANVGDLDKKNGQVIAVYDSDEMYYDMSASGSSAADASDIVRRKISGVRVIPSLGEFIPTAGGTGTLVPMEDILYVYIGTTPYDLRIWKNSAWMIIATSTGDINVKATESTDKYYLTGTDSETSPSVGPLLKNYNVYIENGLLYQDTGKIQGKILDSDHADLSDDATQALYDTVGSTDTDQTRYNLRTYIHSVSGQTTVDGTLFTFALGNGTVIDITATNTQYEIFTATTSGLVAGYNTQASSDNTNVLLTGSGWVNKANIVMPASDSANKDGLGQNIANTYIKGLSFNTGSRNLTYTKGDDTTASVNIPDTTYSVFTSSADGLVPKASGSGDAGKFLMGNATWQTAITPSDIFAGTTAGLVPASTSGVNEKFLRSDGTWFGTFDNDEDGLVPKTGQAQSTDILHADGTWSADLDTKNTAGSTQEDSTQQASPLYIIGAETQAANPQTYSEALVYILDGKLYQSNGAGTPSAVQVVDLTSSQVLENKQFKISGTNYSIGTAVSKSAATSISNTDASVPTNAAVINYVSSQIGSVQTSVNNRVPNASVADLYDATSTYAVGDYVMYDANDTGNAVLYKCNTAISTPEAFDPTKWDAITVMQAVTGTVLVGTLTAGSTSITLSDASITSSSFIQVFAGNGNINYTSISSTEGSVTIGFLAQASDMTVTVRVS